MRYFTRAIGADEMPGPAGDQKVTRQHPEREGDKPCRVTGKAELIQTSKYSGEHLRQIRAKNGVGWASSPEQGRQVNAMYERWLAARRLNASA